MNDTNLSTATCLATAFAAAVFALAAVPAHAAGIACPVAYENGVTVSTACQIGGAHNDFLEPLQVNEDALFDFEDWQFAGKALDSNDPAVVDIGFGVVGNGLGGTWSVDDNTWTTLGVTHLMLVLKGGRAHQPEDGYLAYLIETGATSGTYNSPFVNLNNPQAGLTGISHISAYVRQGTTTVPEPASLTLFGLGLGAACLRRRWRGRE